MRISQSIMRHAVKHLMIFGTLAAMLWAQVFGLQHHLFVCLCTNEPVQTAVDHCHDSTGDQHQALASDHHQDHDCDQQEGEPQPHTPLKEDLKARSQIFAQVTPQAPELVMLFDLPEPLVPKNLSSLTLFAGWTSFDTEHSPPLALQVHQSVVFLI